MKAVDFGKKDRSGAWNADNFPSKLDEVYFSTAYTINKDIRQMTSLPIWVYSQCYK